MFAREANPAKAAQQSPRAFAMPRIQAESADSSPVLRRQVCPCGGGCPRCAAQADRVPESATGEGHAIQSPVPNRHLAHPLQAKLLINTPGDQYEQEADRVAEQVMRMPDAGPATSRAGPGALLGVQRKCSCGGSCDECLPEVANHEAVRLQSKAAGAAGSGHASASLTAPPIVYDVLSSPGQPMEAATCAFFESRFGYDFSSVRVHTDGRAAESARSVGARAYTTGQQIVFGTGQYAPRTADGDRLLAHELVHVVQQSSGQALPELDRGRDDPFERDANRVVDHVLSARGTPVSDPQRAAAVPKQSAAPVTIARAPASRFAINQQDMVYLQNTMSRFYDLLGPDGRASLSRNTTVVIALVTDKVNWPTLVYTVAGNSINPQIRGAAKQLGLARWDPAGIDTIAGEHHAEQLTVEAAGTNFTVHGMAVSRTPCADCGPRIAAEHIPIVFVRIPAASRPAPPAPSRPAGSGGPGTSSAFSAPPSSSVVNSNPDLWQGLYTIDVPDWKFLDLPGKPKTWQSPGAGKEYTLLEVPIPDLGGIVAISGGVRANAEFKTKLTGILSHIQLGLTLIQAVAFDEGALPALVNQRFTGVAELSVAAGVSMSLGGEGKISMGASTIGIDIATLSALLQLSAHGTASLQYGGRIDLLHDEGGLRFEFSQTQKEAELGLRFQLKAGIEASLLSGMFSWTKTWTLVDEEIKKIIWNVEAPIHILYDNDPKVDSSLSEKLESALTWMTEIFEAAHSIDHFVRNPSQALPQGSSSGAPPGRGTPGPSDRGGTPSSSGPCGGNAEPAADWIDFHHYSKRRLSGVIRKGQDWTDYDTNSQNEARAATGVPDALCYQATLKDRDSHPYIPAGAWHDRKFNSIVFGRTVIARHFTANTDVPEDKYSVKELDARR